MSTRKDYHQSYEELVSRLPKKRWVVNHQWTTAETKVIEEYLGRYICRIGISNKRLFYDKNGEHVRIEYNDYGSKKWGSRLPKPTGIWIPCRRCTKYYSTSCPAISSARVTTACTRLQSMSAWRAVCPAS